MTSNTIFGVEKLLENKFSKYVILWAANSRDSLEARRERITGERNFRTTAFNVETLTINRRQPAQHVAVKHEKRFSPENIKRSVTSKGVSSARVEVQWSSLKINNANSMNWRPSVVAWNEQTFLAFEILNHSVEF